MDEGQESTEKVEKTGELQEGLLGLHQKMDQLLEALCGRPVARHTSSFAGKPRRRAADLVERPWDSTPLQEAARFKKPIGGAVVRWRLEGFGFGKVDGADVFTHASVVRGPLEGLVGCRVVVFLEVDVVKSTANDMKYRATELHREQTTRRSWRKLELKRLRRRPCVPRERPSSGRRLRRTPWRRLPWLSCEPSGIVHQAC